MLLASVLKSGYDSTSQRFQGFVEVYMRVSLLIGVLIEFSVSAFAQQNPFGRITGRITDPTGAAVPNVAVLATNVGTNVATAANTNQEGNYEIVNLNPGRYRLSASSSGFRRYERGPLEVRVGDILDISIALEVGAQSDTVTVTAETPLLETATAAVGQVVDSRRIMDLPTPQGNPTYLLQLIPNVMTTNSVGATWTPDGQDQASSFVTAGSPRSQTEFSMDGMANMMGGAPWRSCRPRR